MNTGLKATESGTSAGRKGLNRADKQRTLVIASEFSVVFSKKHIESKTLFTKKEL